MTAYCSGMGRAALVAMMMAGGAMAPFVAADPARAQAATQAMMGMRKLVIAELEAAADGA